jgi:hypothetical protein
MRWSSILLLASSAASVGCWGGTSVGVRADAALDAALDAGGTDVGMTEPDAGRRAGADGAAEAGATTASICSGGCVLNTNKMPPRTDCNTAGTSCVGTCGAGCSIQCKGGADCSVTLTAGSAFECDMGSTCQITVEDPSAIVECTDGAQCNITCKSACRFLCQTKATCNVKCGGQPVTTTMADGTCT